MSSRSMQIFRAGDIGRRDDPEVVKQLVPAQMQSAPPPVSMGDSAKAGIARLMEAGIADGNVIKLLFSAPGFSLTYVWFKPRFPLARHRHDTDCLYYVVSGDVRMGTERLGAGDGVFLPADTFYTFEIGPDGTELLEFRHTSEYGYHFSGGTDAYWDRAVKAVADNRGSWRAMTPPRPAQ